MFRGRRAAFAMLATLVVIAWVGCASKDNSTYPNAPPAGGGTSFNYGPFATLGQSVSRQFTTAGTFGYHCIPHSPGMVGTVQVDAGGSDSAVVEIGQGNALTFTPATAHLKPNGFVRWVRVTTNNSMHTVTSN